VLDLFHSRLYAKAEDVEILKHEPDYVRNRYYAIIKTTLEAPFRWIRQKAADVLHISKRHMHRLVRAFRLRGIPGLRLKSKRIQHVPHRWPPQPVDRPHPGRRLFWKKGQALVFEDDADIEVWMPQAAHDRLLG